MNKAVESLIASLNGFRAQYATHQSNITNASATMRRSEACMAEISKHMTELEKAIVALGGQVPAEPTSYRPDQVIPLPRGTEIPGAAAYMAKSPDPRKLAGTDMTSALLRETGMHTEQTFPFQPACGLKPGCL